MFRSDLWKLSVTLTVLVTTAFVSVRQLPQRAATPSGSYTLLPFACCQ